MDLAATRQLVEQLTLTAIAVIGALGAIGTTAFLTAAGLRALWRHLFPKRQKPEPPDHHTPQADVIGD
ncbi:hypothetical protein ACIBKY_51070 [Nonomuraea sp. NPDC050394]|uniref:hypothetical protein n=1 Tax=Nonomuraea sp. NPDC050394 TaxID=3364363 RepID=UPI0037B5931A